VTNTPVLYTPAEIAAEVDSADPSPEEPVVVQLKQAPVQAVKPTGEDVEIAEVVTAPPADRLVATNAELPKTASPMPLIGLFGLLALGAAFTLQFARAPRPVNDQRVCLPGAPAPACYRKTGRGVLKRKRLQRGIGITCDKESPRYWRRGCVVPTWMGTAAIKPKRGAWQCSPRRC
jgi:hypothetical protein